MNEPEPIEDMFSLDTYYLNKIVFEKICQNKKEMSSLIKKFNIEKLNIFFGKLNIQNSKLLLPCLNKKYLKLLINVRNLRGFSSYNNNDLIKILIYCKENKGGFGIVDKYKNLIIISCPHLIGWRILSFTLNNKDIKNLNRINGIIVSFRLKTISYGNNKLKLHPTDIYEGSNLILRIQKIWRGYRYRIGINKYSNNDKNIVINAIKIQSFIRGYLSRKKKNFKKCKIIRDYNLFLPFNKNILYYYDKDGIKIKLNLMIKPFLPLNKMFFGNIYVYQKDILLFKLSFGDQYGYKIKVKDNKIYEFSIIHCKMNIIITLLPYSIDLMISIRNNNILNNRNLYINIYTKLECLHKTFYYNKIIKNYNKESFKILLLKSQGCDIVEWFNVKKQLKKLNINNKIFKNYSFVKEVCLKHNSIIDIVNCLRFNSNNSNLSYYNKSNKMIRLSYTRLSLIKILISDKYLINIDIVNIISKKIFNNPRFWQLEFQNKWNPAVNIIKKNIKDENKDKYIKELEKLYIVAQSKLNNI